MFEPMEMGNWALETYFYFNWTADPVTGRVYIAPFEEGRYVVHRLDPVGEPIGDLVMETPLIEREQFELQVEKDYVAHWLTAAEGGDPGYSVQCEPWPYRLPISEMSVDDSGNLWVLRGLDDIPVFDIWSPEGDLTGRAELRGMTNGDIRFEVGAGRMLFYYENPTDYQKVYIAGYPAR